MTQRAQYVGLSHQVMDQQHQEWADAQPVHTACLWCKWSYFGPAGVARDKAEQHQRSKHAERLPKRRRRSHSAQRAAAIRASQWKRDRLL